MLRFRMLCFSLLVLVALPGWAHSASDVKGSQDHPLFTRMPGYSISSYETKDFDSYTSAYAPETEASWEGRITKIAYSAGAASPQASMLQIQRNYLNAIKKINGKVLANDESRVVEGKLEKNGAVVWIHAEAFNDGRDYELTLVEKGSMKQDVSADASALRASLAASGKAAVYGIYFDTDKAVIKPASEPAIAEIVNLMAQNAKLALHVVGHTDNAGALAHNLKLSTDRAAAVVKALVDKGVAASRLNPAGVGPYCPMESNRTEAGKAKNRRVELVEE